jgi:hypothetical protein
VRSLEILWIVLFRFKPLPRLWAALLMLVNLGALAFVGTIHGQIALAAMAAAVIVIVLVHAKLGFVRLLGVGHVFWIPMLVWFATNLPDRAAEPALFYWAVALMAFNAGSLVIDAMDVARYMAGERAPYYSWKPDDRPTADAP